MILKRNVRDLSVGEIKIRKQINPEKSATLFDNSWIHTNDDMVVNTLTNSALGMTWKEFTLDSLAIRITFLFLILDYSTVTIKTLCIKTNCIKERFSMGHVFHLEYCIVTQNIRSDT